MGHDPAGGTTRHLAGLVESRGNPRRLLVTILMLIAAMGCAPATAPWPTPTPTAADEYGALEADIENAITSGPASLDKLRAVLVNVDGETKIAHYRHGFTEADHAHVFSVTKSVVSILIGIAIADGLIAGIDRSLGELLPAHREAMSGDTAKVTLRHLMTMSGGFNNQFPGGFVWEDAAAPGGSFVDVLLKRRQNFEPGKIFWYSDASAHLAAAVLAAALERADGGRVQTVLDYAREKLFDPLGITTDPALSGPLPDPFAPEFVTAGFGWGTDPNGIPLGGYGLRLSASDMMKIGELYRRDGVWKGQRIVPSAWIRQCTSPSTFDSKIGSSVDDKYGLLWWIIGPTTQVGYAAIGHGGQRIVVLPKSQAVIVYVAEVQPNSEIDESDLEPLDQVLISALLSRTPCHTGSDNTGLASRPAPSVETCPTQE
jgi:CubicO group peptidase (beta-lactamase class C family)